MHGDKSTKKRGIGKENCLKIWSERKKCLYLQRQTSSLAIRVNFPRGQAVNVTTHLRQSRIFETRLFYLWKLFTCQSQQCQCLNCPQWPLKKGLLGGAMR